MREKDNHPQWPIRPYQTILLLPPEGGWNSILPQDSSPTLKKFIHFAKPTKSFRELAVETDISISQIFRMAGHLVFWGRARVINTLTKTNIYVLNPRAHFSDNFRENPGSYFKVLLDQFASVFSPSFRFEEILDRFSHPKPLANHVNLLIPSLQRDFVDVVVWLLRKNLLIQLYTFIFLNIPKPHYYDPKQQEKLLQQQIHLKEQIKHKELKEEMSQEQLFVSNSLNEHSQVSLPFATVQPLYAYEQEFLTQSDDQSETYKLFVRYFFETVIPFCQRVYSFFSKDLRRTSGAPILSKKFCGEKTSQETT